MAVLGALRRNPVVFAPVLAWTLVQVPELVVRGVNPSLASALPLGRSALLVLVTPFVHAGLVGMADEALDGDASLATFVRAGREQYLPVLGVYLVVLAANSVLGIVAVVGGLVGLVFVLGDGGSAVYAAVGAVAVLWLAVALAVLFLVQFYAHAIVVEGVGAVDGIKRSVALVRRNLLRTFGHSVVGAVAGAVVWLGVALTALLLWVGSPALFGSMRLSTTGVVVGVAAILVIQTLVGGAFAVYSVASYRTLAD
jgi:hypothetical protein